MPLAVQPIGELAIHQVERDLIVRTLVGHVVERVALNPIGDRGINRMIFESDQERWTSLSTRVVAG